MTVGVEDILVVGLNPWLGCAKTQTQKEITLHESYSVRMEKLRVRLFTLFSSKKKKRLFTLFLYKTIGQSALSMHMIDEKPHLLCRLCVQ